jgi:hypothetical protein
MRFVQCAGCGRRIPEGGSKTIGEAPHCPDCHARLSVAAEAQAGPAGAAAPPTEDAPGGCEACDRVTRTMHEIDGFRLCAACVSTSPELAMDVARARHRERLTRLLG